MPQNLGSPASPIDVVRETVGAAADGKAEEVRFTSVPDIFNWNIGNPQPGWEKTIGWFF